MCERILCGHGMYVLDRIYKIDRIKEELENEGRFGSIA